MVYNTETLESLHQLTDLGQDLYHQMLEAAADDILLKSQHPVKWLIQKIEDRFQD